jgi:hypothetical protein
VVFIIRWQSIPQFTLESNVTVLDAASFTNQISRTDTTTGRKLNMIITDITGLPIGDISNIIIDYFIPYYSPCYLSPVGLYPEYFHDAHYTSLSARFVRSKRSTSSFEFDDTTAHCHPWSFRISSLNHWLLPVIEGVDYSRANTYYVFQRLVFGNNIASKWTSLLRSASLIDDINSILQSIRESLPMGFECHQINSLMHYFYHKTTEAMDEDYVITYRNNQSSNPKIIAIMIPHQPYITEDDKPSNTEDLDPAIASLLTALSSRSLSRNM